MLFFVSRRSRSLPEDWDQAVPDGRWPEVLLSAIRSDLAALASPRVISTLQQWRRDLTCDDAPAREHARQRLAAVGEALVAETPGRQVGEPAADLVVEEASEAYTVDAFIRPKRSAAPDGDGPTVAQDVPRTETLDRPGVVHQPVIPDFDVESEPPTAHIALPSSPPEDEGATEDGVDRGGLSAAPPPPDEDLGEKPTTHIPLPDALRPSSGAIENMPPARAISRITAEEEAALQNMAPSEMSEADVVSASRLAAKPGVIRRRSRARPPSEQRPRAAMHHVRALYGVLIPFAEELMPLAFERRSRRFWARWREVAGDRGVRRPFVEDLLRNTATARELACALIAEVHHVDLDSVRLLVERIETGTESRAGGRPRSSVMRPAVKVTGRPNE